MKYVDSEKNRERNEFHAQFDLWPRRGRDLDLCAHGRGGALPALAPLPQPEPVDRAVVGEVGRGRPEGHLRRVGAVRAHGHRLGRDVGRQDQGRVRALRVGQEQSRPPEEPRQGTCQLTQPSDFTFFLAIF